MEELLLKWECDELIIQNFLEHDINVDQLGDLNEDYIKELVPKISDRVKLKSKIIEFTNTSKAPSSIMAPSSSIHLIASEANVRKSSKHINISKIFARRGEGQIVIKYFSEKKCLLPVHRSYITRCLVDHYIGNFGSMSSNDYFVLAEQIVKDFPCENKETYFSPGKTVNGKRTPNKGKLVDRYYNLKKNPLNKGKRKKKEKAAETSGVSNMPSEDVNTEEMKKIKDILHYQQSYSEENVEMWRKSFKLRQCEFRAQGGSNITEVFDNWPILRTSFATKLIELDFEETFPLKSRCVSDKWQAFSNGITKLFNEIKDERGVALVQVLINGNLTPETYNFYLLYLLPFIIKPTTNVTVIGPTLKEISVKPSIVECRDSFILKVNTINNIQVLLDSYLKDQKKKGLMVKPLMIGVVSEEIVNIFVVCGEAKYKCANVAEALSVCFQLHLVLNISFSLESIQIWTLLTKFFFSMETEVNLTNVNSVLATLTSEL